VDIISLNQQRKQRKAAFPTILNRKKFFLDAMVCIIKGKSTFQKFRLTPLAASSISVLSQWSVCSKKCIISSKTSSNFFGFCKVKAISIEQV